MQSFPIAPLQGANAIALAGGPCVLRRVVYQHGSTCLVLLVFACAVRVIGSSCCVACPASAADADLLAGSLRTMAMGDSNACEIAQESHLALAHDVGLLRDGRLLSPSALAPRGNRSTGIIIDDCITTCKEKFVRLPNGRTRPIAAQSIVAD